MKNTKLLLTLAAVASLATAEGALSQTTNTYDENQVLISRIQADKRSVVLQAMQLSDTQVAQFTPVYDKYQAEMKGQFERGTEVLNKFASNYQSMTDDAAKDIMKDWFKLRDQRNDILKKYAKEMGRKLPAAEVLRWVQIENKLMALLDVQAAAVVPVALKQ